MKLFLRPFRVFGSPSLTNLCSIQSGQVKGRVDGTHVQLLSSVAPRLKRHAQVCKRTISLRRELRVAERLAYVERMNSDRYTG